MSKWNCDDNQMIRVLSLRTCFGLIVYEHIHNMRHVIMIDGVWTWSSAEFIVKNIDLTHPWKLLSVRASVFCSDSNIGVKSATCSERIVRSEYLAEITNVLTVAVQSRQFYRFTAFWRNSKMKCTKNLPGYMPSNVKYWNETFISNIVIWRPLDVNLANFWLLN